MKKCNGCNENKIKKAYRFDDDLCSKCYTSKRINDYNIYGTEWLIECTKCFKVANVFDNFDKINFTGCYNSRCKECVKKDGRERSRNRYIKKGNRFVSFSSMRNLSKEKQRNFVEKFKKVWENE